eukprot:g79565.t1
MAAYRSRLYKAAQQGNLLETKVLLKAKADPNYAPPTGARHTPVMRAAWRGHSEVVRALLQAQADPQLTDSTGWTALMLAVGSHGSFNDNPELVQLLGKWEAGQAVINHSDQEGWTALMLACANGKTLACQQLLELDASVNQQANNGWTALIWAAWNGREAIAQLLLDDWNADATLTTKKGHTALDKALERGHGGVAQLLTQNMERFGDVLAVLTQLAVLPAVLAELTAEYSTCRYQARPETLLEQKHAGTTEIRNGGSASSSSSSSIPQARRRRASSQGTDLSGDSSCSSHNNSDSDQGLDSE